MCKLLLMTGIQDSRLGLEFMMRMGKPMSLSNPHGIGYTAAKSNGDIFSQRWLNNDSFFDKDSIMTPEIAEQLAPFIKRLPKGALEQNYGEYGEIDYDDIKSLTLHTRFATCGREFANTHPFIYDDVSLVHNGVIRNAETLNVNKISTCDSEAALQTYLAQGVLNDSSKAKAWLDLLSGGYAFGILGRNTNGNRILDVVRGSSFLYYLEAGPLGKIFTTDDVDALKVLKDMNIEVTRLPGLVNYNSMYRFDAITGELLQEIDVKPKYASSFTNPSSTSYYQHGRSTGTSYSGPRYTKPSRFPSEVDESRMSQKDIEYTAALMEDAMGNDEYPDLKDSKGNWDYRKVKTYTNDLNEPFLDRLDIWDTVFSDNTAMEYELLPDALQEYVSDTDMMEGFKAARKVLSELVKTKGSVMG